MEKQERSGVLTKPESGKESATENAASSLFDQYSRRALEHMLSPRNLGMLPDPDGHAHLTGPCGDTVEVFLLVVEGQVREACFLVEGCNNTLACGDAACELVKGKVAQEAFQVNQKKILDYLGGLPREKEHCAGLVANAMRMALLQYLENRKDPWKKAYR